MELAFPINSFTFGPNGQGRARARTEARLEDKGPASPAQETVIELEPVGGVWVHPEAVALTEWERPPTRLSQPALVVLQAYAQLPPTPPKGALLNTFA